MLKFIKSVLGRGSVPFQTHELDSPTPAHVPMIRNDQNRSVPQFPEQRIRSDWYVDALEANIRSRQTVPSPVYTQPAFKLARGPWHRDGSRHPIYRNGDLGNRMPSRQSAPARTQSIPGYVESQIQTTRSGINAKLQIQYRNMRAPGINESTNGCINNG